MNKRKAVRERVLSLVLAMLLVVTGIPVNGLVVNAEELEPEATVEATEPVEESTDEVSDDVIDAEEVNDENEEEMPVAEEPADEEEEKEEKGGETYQVIAGDYADYVSIYKEVDGSMEEVADVASESFVAGDKVCVVVKEGYAWTLLVDDSELEADEELEGYVFTIGEEDLELAEVYAIEAGDGVETTEAVKGQSIIGPSKVTYKGEDITVTSDADGGSGDYVITLGTTYGSGNTSIPADSVVAEITYAKGSTSDAFLCDAKLVENKSSGSLTAYTITIPADVLTTDGGESNPVTLSAKLVDVYTINTANVVVSTTSSNVSVDKVSVTPENNIATTTGTLGSNEYKYGTNVKVTATVTATTGYGINKSSGITFGGVTATAANDEQGQAIADTYEATLVVGKSLTTASVEVVATASKEHTAKAKISDIILVDASGNETHVSSDDFANYVNFTPTGVKFLECDSSVTVTGSISVENANYVITSVYESSDATKKNKHTSGSVSVRNTLSSQTTDLEVSLTVVLTAKKEASFTNDDLTSDVTSVTFTDYKSLKSSDFAVYKNSGSYYVEVNAVNGKYSFLKDDSIAIVSKVDYAVISTLTATPAGASAITASSSTINLDATHSIDNAFVFTAGKGVHTLAITTTLSKDLVEFKQGAYTVEVTDAADNVVDTLNPTTKDAFYVWNGTDTIKITATDGYLLTKVDSDTYTEGKTSVELSLSQTTAEHTVTVESKKGYQAKLSIGDHVNVYTDETDAKNDTTANKVTDGSNIFVDGSTTLYFVLETGTDSQGAKTYPYKLNTLTLNGSAQSYTEAFGGEDGKISVYKSTFNFTKNSEIVVNAVLKTGYQITFGGDGAAYYTAYVFENEKIDTSSLPANVYGKDYQFVDDFATSKDILLVAKDGYRFSNVTFENTSIEPVYKNSGAYVEIKGITKASFPDAVDGYQTLAVEADLEETIEFTVENNEGLAIVVNEDDYTHHATTGAYNKGSYKYDVKAGNALTVIVQVDANKLVSSATLTAGSKVTEITDIELDDDYNKTDTTHAYYVISVPEFTVASTLDFDVDYNADLVKGIEFVKENYTVTSTDYTDLAQFVDAKGNVLDSVINYFDQLKDSDTLTLKLTATTGYEIASITYNDEEIYNDADGSVKSETAGLAYTKASGELTIPGKSVLANQEQAKLVVTTKADDLASAFDFTVSYAGIQYMKTEGVETDKVFFDAVKELKVDVKGDTLTKTSTSGRSTEYNVGEDNVANSITAGYITVSVTAPTGVTPVVKIQTISSGTATDVTNDILPIISTSGKVTTYKFAASALSNALDTNDKLEIVVDGKVDTKEVTFTYDKKLVDVTMAQFDKDDTYEAGHSPYSEVSTAHKTDEYGKPTNDDMYVATYKVRTGSKVSGNVSVKEDTKYDRYVAVLNSVTAAVCEEYEADYEYTVNADTAIEIAATKLNANILESSAGYEVIEEDGSLISYKTTYTAFRFEGAKKAAVNAAELLVDGVSRSVAVNNTKDGVSFSVTQADAKKAVKLTLKYEEEGKDTIPVAEFNFVVAETLTSEGLVVEDVVDGVLTQTVDTEGYYAITLPEGTNIADLSVTATNGVDVAITKDGELYVAAPTKAASDKASVITLKNNKLSSNKTLQTITLKTVEVAGLVDAKIGVTPLTHTSTNLRLALTASSVANVDLYAGDLAYHVTVTEQKKSSSTAQHFYVLYESDTTYADVKVLDKDAEKETKYNVSVQLVRLDVPYNTKNIDVKKNIICSSNDVFNGTGTDDYVLNVPAYTNVGELSLINQVNKVSTGLETVIADVDFGNNTNKIKATVELYYANGKRVTGGYYANVNNDKVYFTAYSSLGFATYTVKVIAENPEKADTIEVSATMSLTVENGVWDIELKNVPDTLFKADKKVASFKATAVINDNKITGLKNKKVTWELYKSISDDGTFKPITSSDALYGMITVKNGTVTVNKDYSVSKKASDNSFVLVARSEERTDVIGVAEVTITNEAVDLGELVLVQANENHTKFTKLADQTKVTSDLVNKGEIYLVAVKNSASALTTYTTKHMVAHNVTFKSSNKNLDGDQYLRNDNDELVCAYQLSIKNVVSNVKVTLTAMDGSKKFVQKTFSVDYADMSNLVLSVGGNPVAKNSYSYIGTSEDTVEVILGHYVNEDFKEFEGILNAKVSVSGGKILSAIGNTYVVKLNKDSATFTVQDKADKSAVPTTCVLTNTAYAGFSKTSAPVVSASAKNIIANSYSKQSMTYTFKKAANYKFVKVQVAYADWYKLYSKNVNPNIYEDLEEATGMDQYGYMIYPITDGSFTMTFNAGYPLSAGAYKVYFSYGDFDANGNFVPATKAGSVTIKAVASKSVDYTVDSSYALSLIDTTSAALTGKTAKANASATVEYLGVYNDVVSNNKNAFTQFFSLNEDKTQLTLNSYDSLLNISYGKNKNYVDYLKTLVGTTDENLTGYVAYRVNGGAEQFAKVSVSLSNTALKTYSADSVTMLKGKNVVLPLNIYANNSEVKAVKASVSGSSFAYKAINDGVVSIYSKTTTEGSNTVNVRILPETSFYISENGNTIANDLKNYGVDVAVNVEAKATADPVVTFDNLSVTFDSYNGNTKCYEGTIPYTSNIANAFTAKTKDSKLSSKVTFTQDAANNCIKVSVAKSVLEDGSAVSYGTTSTIAVVLTFCNNATATHNFNVKFPSSTSFTTESYKQIFTNIRKALWTGVSDNTFPTTVDFSEAIALETKLDSRTAAVEKLYLDAAKAAVISAVESQFEMGADVYVKDTTVTFNVAGDAIEADVYLAGNDVKQDYTVEVLEAVGTTYAGTYKVHTEIAVEDVLYTLGTLVSAVGTFSYDLKDGKFKEEGLLPTNDITLDKIVSLARENVLAEVDNSYKLIFDADSWKLEKATSVDEGRYYVEVSVMNVYDMTDTRDTIISGTIAELKSVTDVYNEFAKYYTALQDGTLNEVVEDNNFSFTILNMATDKSVIEELAKAAIAACGNDNINYSFTDEKEFAIDENGKLSGELYFTETVNEVTYTSNKYPFTGKVATTGNDSKVTAAVNGKLGDNITAALLTTDQNETKANIELAATQAIGDAPYTVEVSITSYTAPTVSVSGVVKYAVTLTPFDSTKDAITLSYVNSINYRGEFQSFDDVVALIKDKFLKKTTTEITNDWFTDGAVDWDNKVLTELKSYNKNSDFTVAYADIENDTFTSLVDAHEYEPATIKADGTFSLTLKVTDATRQGDDGNDYFELIELNKTFTKLTQSEADAKAKISALKTDAKFTALIKKSSLDNADDLYAYAEALLDTDTYTVDIDVDVDDNTKPTKLIVTIELTNTDGKQLITPAVTIEKSL